MGYGSSWTVWASRTVTVRSVRQSVAVDVDGVPRRAVVAGDAFGGDGHAAVINADGDGVAAVDERTAPPPQ